MTATTVDRTGEVRRRCLGCGLRHRSIYNLCLACREDYDHGLYGGTWVLDHRRRVLVWRAA